MSDQWSQNSTLTQGAAREIDEGLRIYMMKVYNYMGLGLLITALAAYAGASSGIYYAIAQTPLVYVVMFAPLGFVFFLNMRLHKMSSSAAQLTFWLFSGLMGFSLSYVLLAFTGESIVTTFLVTAAAFGSLSLYGYTTKRSLSGMGSFLFMGLIGIIIAMVVNLFVQSSALHFAVSVIGVLIFAGLTAYDTQKIKQIYLASDSREIAEKKALMGALALYLDFINMFLFLLQFLGNRE